MREVDKERGRIGLKLVAKHENGDLVQPEVLIERAKDAPPRAPARSARAAATAAAVGARSRRGLSRDGAVVTRGGESRPSALDHGGSVLLEAS